MQLHCKVKKKIINEKKTYLKKKKYNKMTLKKIKKPYSLKNKKTNRIPLNSKLKPLTSSLSPSEKSNRARFNSTKIRIIKHKKGYKKITLNP